MEQSIAAQWVDEMATLRVISAKYGLDYAKQLEMDGTSISDRFGSIVTQTWDYGPESPFISWRAFPDGSEAILHRDNERWEIHRGNAS